MHLEYLVLKENYNSNIEKYKYTYDVKSNNITTRTIESVVDILVLNESEARVIRIEVINCSDAEELAKHLSYINDEVVKSFKLTTLRNDASAYFNKRLYPLANEFERELRRFLYLKNALYTGEKVKKNIEGLESKDLGEIYQLLFVDEDFCKEIKAVVNGKEKNGTF